MGHDSSSLSDDLHQSESLNSYNESQSGETPFNQPDGLSTSIPSSNNVPGSTLHLIPGDAEVIQDESSENYGQTDGMMSHTLGIKPQPAAENFWIELRNILFLSIVLAFGIRHFVAEARYIPSESMLPTLEVNDRLIVEKISYRFREPKRGDVVVFRPTDAIKKAQPDFNDALIKRIIGLPGDTVEVQNGEVYVNGQILVESYIDEAPDYPWGPQVIPEDSYLVLGDNRNNSYDSHFWGFVPQENLIGRAAVRVWPLDRLGALNEKPLFYFEEITPSGSSPSSQNIED